MPVFYKNLSKVNVRFSNAVMFGEAWYDAGGGYERIQADYQFLIVQVGEARVSLRHKSFPVPAGSVALMLPEHYECIRFSQSRRTCHTWCAVNVSKVPSPLKKRLTKLPSVQLQSTAFDCMMKAAFNIRSWHTRAAAQVINTLSFALIDEYIRMAKGEKAGTPEESPCERARLYMEEHSENPNCLHEAVRASGVTHAHLIRLFRNYYQTPPSNYLWRFRVQRGSELLKHTGLNITGVAYRCGFKDPFHFSHLFRKMQGVAPREFRRQAWSQTK